MKMAGTEGEFETRPYGTGNGLSSEGSLMSVVALAPISMEMGTKRRTGNHKGCPYNGIVGAYFQGNRSCRLSHWHP